ncbi:MAG: DNA alkylation repair protein [Crocinitomicaceae bacterium]|nr:DNA alkylation repair protein [Crocinitomicaceae bacterium]MBK8925578.1 DNA alkylation repair protein [Crocinitomicaceae bacterium]
MAEALRDMFSRSFLNSLEKKFVSVSKDFNQKTFQKSILNSNYSSLELKQRVRAISQAMSDALPVSYKKQIHILKEVAPHVNGFCGTIFPDFVEKNGLNDYKTSIDALEFFTPFSTAEFAIRPFIVSYPETMGQMHRWTDHENHHVRRLASEGCRPLLPWGMRLQVFVENPIPVLPILEKLKNDSSDYVYRSVANNLNDISKHHPDLILNIAKKWYGNSDTTNKVVKHALRTLLKKGNQTAMQIIGFDETKLPLVKSFTLSDIDIEIGSKIILHTELIANKNGRIRLEYEVEFPKKNKSHGIKVFQLGEKTLKKGEQISITKSHSFADLSTRKHYSGEHKFTLKMNGIKSKSVSVLLRDK